MIIKNNTNTTQTLRINNGSIVMERFGPNEEKNIPYVISVGQIISVNLISNGFFSVKNTAIEQDQEKIEIKNVVEKKEKKEKKHTDENLEVKIAKDKTDDYINQ